MDLEQIARVQEFNGDPIEEYWKPRLPGGYVDLFNFWELRWTFRAYLLEHLRPANSHVLSKGFLDKHERLGSYSYTAFCRVAAAHQCLQDLQRYIKEGGEVPMFHILNAFEAFHFFLGSALENVAGVGNIVFGYNCKEDSYSGFLKAFRSDDSRSERSLETVNALEEALRVKANYRDHISHRGRLASRVILHEGHLVPTFESDFTRSPSATHASTWRKQLRNMNEGRKEAIPAPELCAKHLGILERAADTLFGICRSAAASYLSTNSVEVTAEANGFDIDLASVPNKAVYVLFRCRAETRSYLNMWHHKIGSGPLPSECINAACSSQDIEAMYYVSE